MTQALEVAAIERAGSELKMSRFKSGIEKNGCVQYGRYTLVNFRMSINKSEIACSENRPSSCNLQVRVLLKFLFVAAALTRAWARTSSHDMYTPRTPHSPRERQLKLYL